MNRDIPTRQTGGSPERTTARGRAASPRERLVIGVFLFLVAAAVAAAPLPMVLRSAGVLAATYLSYGVVGSNGGFATGLVAPLVGLLTAPYEWLVMLPIILSSNLLAVMGLDLAWRYPALVVSPLLQVVPQLVVAALSQQTLFEVDLPWAPNVNGWILLHLLVALAGTLLLVFLDRRSERRAGSRPASDIKTNTATD